MLVIKKDQKKRKNIFSLTLKIVPFKVEWKLMEMEFPVKMGKEEKDYL